MATILEVVIRTVMIGLATLAIFTSTQVLDKDSTVAGLTVIIAILLLLAQHFVFKKSTYHE